MSCGSTRTTTNTRIRASSRTRAKSRTEARASAYLVTSGRGRARSRTSRRSGTRPRLARKTKRRWGGTRHACAWPRSRRLHQRGLRHRLRRLPPLRRRFRLRPRRRLRCFLRLLPLPILLLSKFAPTTASGQSILLKGRNSSILRRTRNATTGDPERSLPRARLDTTALTAGTDTRPTLALLLYNQIDQSKISSNF
jgi:hypothetical protein